MEPEEGSRLFVSLARRRHARGETLLLVNESWSPRRERLRMTRSGRALTIWDPWNGDRRVVRERVAASDVLELAFDPVEALVVTLELDAPARADAVTAGNATPHADRPAEAD